MITRLAPTPSGYLHEGNAVNFQLIAWHAQAAGGEIVLRIDDLDAPRYRPEYVEDTLRVLEWLGIAWHRGPTSLAEFEATYSMRRRTDYYREQLALLSGSGLETYVCRCSRRVMATSSPCPGGCRDRREPLSVGESALRVHVPAGTSIEVSGRAVALPEAMGDFVVWRRDGLPAYQLVSVIEDRDLGVTDIVRGADLLESTAAQLFLSTGLRADSVTHARYVHHPLITDAAGHKLSKSRRDAGPMDRTHALRERVRHAAVRLGGPLGIIPPA